MICKLQIHFWIVSFIILVQLTLIALPANDPCVELWLKQKPDLRNRFSVKQIQWLCERTNDWVQRALTPSEIPADDITTPKQRAW